MGTAMGLTLGLAAVVVLIALNGVFVAGEFALLAVDTSQVDALAAQGRRRARGVRALLRRLSFQLGGAQLGITLTSLVLGIIAEGTVGRLIELALGGWAEPLANAGVIAAAAIAIAAVSQMVLGELAPKNLAVSRPLGTSMALAGVLRIYGIVAAPVIWVFNGIANATVRALGLKPTEELRIVRTRDELEYVVRSSRQRTLSDEQAALLVRALRLGRKDAADALTPRTKMSAVSAKATLDELVELARQSGHSRFPVLGESSDDVLGIAEVRDVFAVPAEQRAHTPLATLMRPAVVVAESRKLDGVLADMAAADSRFCVVVDEHGGTAGVLTRTDIAEELVGDIPDEFDEPEFAEFDEPEFAEFDEPGFGESSGTDSVSPDGSQGPSSGPIRLAGTATLDELEDASGLAAPEGPYETLAGLVLALAGEIPAVGDEVQCEGWTLRAAELDGLRVAAVEVMPPSAASETGESAAEGNRS